MRHYEDLQRIQENRLKQRAYYIPENDGAMVSLNGIWDFSFYNRDFDEAPAAAGSIDVPSCWQSRGYEKPNYITRNPDCLYGINRYNRSGLYSTEEFMSKLLKE